jgi:hypothetical protein
MIFHSKHGYVFLTGHLSEADKKKINELVSPLHARISFMDNEKNIVDFIFDSKKTTLGQIQMALSQAGYQVSV